MARNVHPHSLGVEVLLRCQGSLHHGAENMAKAVMQNMEVSFLPGKNLNKRGVVSCLNSGCKWKSPCGPYCLAVRKRAS